MLFGNVLVLSVFLVMDVDAFNRLTDRLIPLYLVVCVLLIALYETRHRKQLKNEENSALRTYVYKKKPKFDPKDWKRRFFGKWDKITRTNFYEFMIFNGAPSMVASLNKDASFQQEILDLDGDGKRTQFNSFGIPAITGNPTVIGDDLDSAVPVRGKDAKKGDFSMRIYWNEAEKTLLARIDFDNGWAGEHYRRVDDDDVLHFKNTMTKPDGTSAYFAATLKRIG